MYFVTFIYNYSRWCTVYLIKNRREVFDKFLQYKSMIENITGKKIKALQSDNGTEYCNNRFEDFLRKAGIARD